jgi:uncharacterized membrane protein SpoIIM required for sporulation
MHEQIDGTHGRVMFIARALSRARCSILTVALTYLVSVIVGIAMVHAGNDFAIGYRDTIVSRAQSSPIIVALDQNDRWRAALLDVGGNLFGAVATSLSGLGVLVAYPIMAYRGWIGGIVSLNSAHVSRFADPSEAWYYIVTLVLQLTPYTLSGGAGVNMGLAFVRPRAHYQGEKWLGIPKEAIRDLLWIYLLVVPLFLVASLWEFFAR